MSRPLHVYVAGSSDELDRAVRWMAALRDAGIVVTSTWAANIAAVGSANPRDASKIDRAHWATMCIRELRTSKVLWLLTPAVGHGRGAYVELGAMLADDMGQLIVASGDTKQSIFNALAVEHETDEDAFASIVTFARRRG